MLATNATRPVDSRKPPTGVPKANVRATWKFALEKVVRQGGPYAGHPKTEKLDSLVTSEVRLLPWGVPGRRLGGEDHAFGPKMSTIRRG